MNTQEITSTLQSKLFKQGLKSAIVSASHATELRQSIGENLRNGKIDETVYRLYSLYFDGMLSQDISWAQSIVVVTVPQPILEVVFTIEGEKRSTIIPPTYDHSVDKAVTAILEEELKPHGFRISRAILPQKLLATHAGLARYGKNNITYVDGMGSFHRLLSFYSDLPTVRDSWQAPGVIEECTRCNACTKSCPTGAIDPDQFQLHAEKCLTFHNESSEPFPQWIDESWHHCLVGCMKCQENCPLNKDIRSWVERLAEFTSEESILLLSGAKQSEIPQNLILRFRNTGLSEDPALLGRNLRSVLGESK